MSSGQDIGKVGAEHLDVEILDRNGAGEVS
jgi:hypothetical protein